MIDHPEYRIVMSKFGPAHGLKGPDGRFAVCRRNASLCKYCREDGIPMIAPDPFTVMTDALLENWDKRWFEVNRNTPRLQDDQVYEGVGIHIVARSDDRRDSTVLISFGDDDQIMAAVGALVHVHNIMIGKPD